MDVKNEENELSPELLAFEAYLRKHEKSLKSTPVQLHNALQLLCDVVHKSYNGSMSSLLDRCAAANECSRFTRDLTEIVNTRGWKESTRKSYVGRLKVILSQHAGLPESFVCNIRVPLRAPVPFNKILGRKLGRHDARNEQESYTKQLLEKWVETLRAETKQTSPLTLRNTIGFIVNSCLPALGLRLDSWPENPCHVAEAAIQNDSEIFEKICGKPGESGSRGKAQWLTYFLKDILGIPGQVPRVYFAKFRRGRGVGEDDDDGDSFRACVGDVHRIKSDDLEKIYAAAKGHPRDELIFMLLLTTGLRVGGLVRIQVASVADVIDERYIVRTQGRTREKGDKAVSFFLSENVRSLIWAWLVEHRPGTLSPYLFPAKTGTGPMSTEAVRAAFSRLCRDAGVNGKEFHPHGLRHTCAHLLLEAGNPVDIVSKCLNHSSSQITEQVYLRENIQEICSRACIPWLQGERASEQKPKLPAFLSNAGPGASQPARKRQRLERKLHDIEMLG